MRSFIIIFIILIVVLSIVFIYNSTGITGTDELYRSYEYQMNNNIDNTINYRRNNNYVNKPIVGNHEDNEDNEDNIDKKLIPVDEIPKHIKSDVKIIKKIGQGTYGIAYMCEDNKVLKISIEYDDFNESIKAYQDKMDKIIEEGEKYGITYPRIYNHIIYENPGFYMLDSDTTWAKMIGTKEMHQQAPFISEQVMDYIPGKSVSSILKGYANEIKMAKMNNVDNMDNMDKINQILHNKNNIKILKKIILASKILIDNNLKPMDVNLDNRLYTEDGKLGVIDIDLMVIPEDDNSISKIDTRDRFAVALIYVFLITYIESIVICYLDTINKYIGFNDKLEIREIIYKYEEDPMLFMGLVDYNNSYVNLNLYGMAKIFIILYVHCEEVLINAIGQMISEHDLLDYLYILDKKDVGKLFEIAMEGKPEVLDKYLKNM